MFDVDHYQVTISSTEGIINETVTANTFTTTNSVFPNLNYSVFVRTVSKCNQTSDPAEYFAGFGKWSF